MATAAAPAPAVTAPARGAAPPFPGNIWRAPLVPVALAATAGIVADRYLALPLVGSLLGVVVGLVAWGIGFACRQRGLPLVYLALAVASLLAAYHHLRHDVYAADDIGNPARLGDGGAAELPARRLHAGRPGGHAGPAGRRVGRRLGEGAAPGGGPAAGAAAGGRGRRRTARGRRGGGGRPAGEAVGAGQPRRLRSRRPPARPARPRRGAGPQDGRRRGAARPRLAVVLRRPAGRRAGVGAEGTPAGAAAATERRRRGPAPRRKHGDGEPGVGKVRPHRGRPRPGHLGAAPRRDGFRPVVGAAAGGRAAALGGLCGGGGAVRLRAAGGRQPAGDALGRDGAGGLRRPAAAPGRAAGQLVRPGVAGRR